MPSEIEVWNLQIMYQINQQGCLKCVNFKNYINFQNLATKQKIFNVHELLLSISCIGVDGFNSVCLIVWTDSENFVLKKRASKFRFGIDSTWGLTGMAEHE